MIKKKRKKNNMLLIVFSLLMGLLPFLVCGQQKLSKAEIAAYQKEDKLRQEQDPVKLIDNFTSSESVHEALKNKMNKLQRSCDTFGFFLITDVGMVSIDSCYKGNTLSSIFILWQDEGKTFYQKMANHCIWPEKEGDGISFFKFYKGNVSAINNEVILPVITGAVKRGNNISYNMITVSHEPSYIIYCKFGRNEKAISFSQSDITEHQSLFYNENIKLKSVEWFWKNKEELQMKKRTDMLQ